MILKIDITNWIDKEGQLRWAYDSGISHQPSHERRYFNHLKELQVRNGVADEMLAIAPLDEVIYQAVREYYQRLDLKGIESRCEADNPTA